MSKRKEIDEIFNILESNNVSIEMKPRNEVIDYIIPDDDYDFHSYRILLLINKCGVLKESLSKFPILFGRTKFAFYDFLLRNPFYLEKVIDKKAPKLKKAILYAKLDLKPYEKDISFSSMVKYIRGPWDPRYDNIFSYMVSKQLATVQYDFITESSSTREFMLILTVLGFQISSTFVEEQPLWVSRMDIITSIFPNNTTENHIKNTH